MSSTPFRINSLTTRGKSLVAAALLSGGPYKMRLGLAPALDGVSGEPTPGVSGYSRPTITLANVGGQIVVTSTVTFGAFSASLGPALAFALEDATGQAFISEWLEEQRMMANTTSLVFLPGQIRVNV